MNYLEWLISTCKTLNSDLSLNTRSSAAPTHYSSVLIQDSRFKIQFLVPQIDKGFSSIDLQKLVPLFASVRPNS